MNRNGANCGGVLTLLYRDSIGLMHAVAVHLRVAQLVTIDMVCFFYGSHYSAPGSRTYSHTIVLIRNGILQE